MLHASAIGNMRKRGQGRGCRLPVFKMASRLAVDIAIESLLENEVEEISRDGQEKYVP